MAVSVQTQYYTKSVWNSVEPHSPFSSFISDAPTAATMTYQYPLGSTGPDQSSNMAHSYHHHAGHSSQANSPALANEPSPVPKNRGMMAKSSKIKRSSSTPNVRGQASADAAALALSAEKRRNKLGYHRTSVACGHCRRRKIRCIPAPADPQNRCSNCIRLKKECNFYPVDQQTQAEPRRASKTQSGTGGISESSSPSTSSGQLPDMQPGLPYSHMNMPSIQDLGGPQMKRQRTESFSPETKVVTSSRNFEYSHGSQSNWGGPDASPAVRSHSELPHPDAPNMYWKSTHQESPITPAFSPFTPSGQVPPVHTWPNNHPEPSPREDLTWSVPQRSMSYSHLEAAPNQYSQSYQPPTHSQNHPADQYAPKSRLSHPGMYPPSISTTSGHSAGEYVVATTSGSPLHAQSAGALPPVGYSHWQQPYSYQRPVLPSSEPYGSWSTSQPAHHIAEEGHGQPVNYGMPDPSYQYPHPQGR